MILSTMVDVPNRGLANDAFNVEQNGEPQITSIAFFLRPSASRALQPSAWVKLEESKLEHLENSLLSTLPGLKMHLPPTLLT